MTNSLICIRSQDFTSICCSVLLSVAVCCGVLQCVEVCCTVLQCVAIDSLARLRLHVLQCVAACCSVLQCVAVCCSVLQHIGSQDFAPICCSVLQCIWNIWPNRILTCPHAMHHVLHLYATHDMFARKTSPPSLTMCCSVLLFFAVCCRCRG